MRKRVPLTGLAVRTRETLRIPLAKESATRTYLAQLTGLHGDNEIIMREGQLVVRLHILLVGGNAPRLISFARIFYGIGNETINSNSCRIFRFDVVIAPKARSGVDFNLT